MKEIYKLFLVIYLVIYFLIVVRFRDIDMNKIKEVPKIEEDTTKLEKFLKNNLVERVKKLKNMSLKDWIDYNRKNNEVEFDNKKYSLFAWEKIDDEYINRVQTSKKLENLSWTNTYEIVKDIQKLSKYKTDQNLVDNMFKISRNMPNSFEYFWIDYTDKFNVKKEKSIVISFKKNGVDGVMGFPFTVLGNVQEGDNKEIHDSIGKIPFDINYLITGLIIFIILSRDNIKHKYLISLFIGFISIGYSFYFLTRKISSNEPDFEIDKSNLIARSVTALAFLSGVNIFIINQSNNENKTLFSLIFSGSIVFLLLSVFKSPKVSNVIDIFKSRTQSLYFYNLCIIFNLFSLLTFMIGTIF